MPLPLDIFRRRELGRSSLFLGFLDDSVEVLTGLNKEGTCSPQRAWNGHRFVAVAGGMYGLW